MNPEHAADQAQEALAPHIAVLEHAEWTAMLLDTDWCIRWVSPELQAFLGETDPARLGYGQSVAEMLRLPAWTRVVAPDSMLEMVSQIGPYLLGDLIDRGASLTDSVPEDLAAVLQDMQPVSPPAMWSSAFHYVHPHGVEELGGYTVKALVTRVGQPNDDVGWLVLFDVDVPPRLVSLLARGDHAMYERMARLVTPGPRAAAILFCDLQGSGVLSRKLPTAEYFRLVRRLWTEIDATVAHHCGVVGKHAGDGAAAFFLGDELGSESAAARAAILAARRIHHVSADLFRETADLECLMKVGVHWGSALYMGQLVPGGRLDVTALGDEVNEAARIEEAADAHETLASKQLLERLSPAHVAELGLPGRVFYRLLHELAPEDSKIVRDAGNIAVTPV